MMGCYRDTKDCSPHLRGTAQQCSQLLEPLDQTTSRCHLRSHSCSAPSSPLLPFPLPHVCLLRALPRKLHGPESPSPALLLGNLTPDRRRACKQKRTMHVILLWSRTLRSHGVLRPRETCLGWGERVRDVSPIKQYCSSPVGRKHPKW